MKITFFNMDIFLSWSGDRSKKLATEFNSFIAKIIQQCNPFLSTQDINLGEIWQRALLKEIVNRKFGLLFITPENKLSHWLHYEAGGLIKDLEKDRVVPILFGIQKKDVLTPFSQFQMIEFGHEEVFTLLKQINSQTIKPIAEDVLKELFGTFYPSFSAKIQNIIEANPAKEKSRSTDDLLGEILILSREQRIKTEEMFSRQMRALDTTSFMAESYFKTLKKQNQNPPFDKAIYEFALEWVENLSRAKFSPTELHKIISAIPDETVRLNLFAWLDAQI